MTEIVPVDLNSIARPLQQLQMLEADLSGRLLERDEVVRAALVAVLARQHIVLIGSPGTAKSLLVEMIAERIIQAGQPALAFIWLLTRFTTPDELFGPISVKGLKNDEYRRITTNKLPESLFGFLDEIFKANSAVLNALLSILNERVFDNGPQRTQVPLITCFGASNELPQGDDLKALWDRFALRLMVDYVSDAAFPKLLQLAALQTPPVTLDMADLVLLQQTAAAMSVPSSVIDALVGLRKKLAGQGLIASDRRWRQSLNLLRAHALIEGRPAVEEDDLTILRDALWTTPDQRQEIGRIVAQLANPLIGRAVELGDQAASVHEIAMAAQRGSGDDQAKMSAAVEAASKLKNITGQLTRLLDQARSQGRSTSRIEKVAGQVKEMRGQVAELVVS